MTESHLRVIFSTVTEKGGKNISTFISKIWEYEEVQMPTTAYCYTQWEKGLLNNAFSDIVQNKFSTGEGSALASAFPGI